MFISKEKQIYVINKIIEEINRSTSYEMDKGVYYKTYTLKYPTIPLNIYANSRDLRIRFHFDDNVLKKITLDRENGSIDIENNSLLSKYFEKMEKIMFDRLDYIDDVKFKKIFPEYDLNQERDGRIAAILDDTENANENAGNEDNGSKKNGFFNKILKKLK